MGRPFVHPGGPRVAFGPETGSFRTVMPRLRVLETTLSNRSRTAGFYFGGFYYGFRYAG